MKNFIIAILSCLTFAGVAQSQLEPVVWKISYHEINKGEGEIIYTATIADNWHTYSQKVTEDGPVPTSFTVNPSDHFELVGKPEETGAHEEYVKAFEAKVYLFEHEAVFKQKIKRKSNHAFSVSAYVEYMSCNDVQCNPPKILSLPLEVPAVTSEGKH